jgi:hypothetical protein
MINPTRKIAPKTNYNRSISHPFFGRFFFFFKKQLFLKFFLKFFKYIAWFDLKIEWIFKSDKTSKFQSCY